MEDFKPNFQEIFLTFGLGSLFCAVLLFQMTPSIWAIHLPEQLGNTQVAEPLWVPISVGLVFLFHAIGRSVIAAGAIVGHFIKFGNVRPNEIYSELMRVDNVWLWKRFFETEANLRFLNGIIGICVLSLMSYAVGIYDGHIVLSSSVTAEVFLFASSATVCLIQAKVALLEVRVLILAHKEDMQVMELNSTITSN